MFKKLNTKILIVAIVAMAGLLLIAEYTGKKDRSFRSVLIAADTALISKIEISFPESAGIQLLREHNNWKVSTRDGETSYTADPQVVQSILAQLVMMKPDRIAANSKEKWKSLQVDDSAAVRVDVYQSKKQPLASLFLGNISVGQQPANQQMMQQQQPDIKTFVRVGGDERVYTVDGFLKMSYQPQLSAYRNKMLLQLNAQDISRLEFAGNNRFDLSKTESGWLLNGQQAVDSTRMAGYLRELSRKFSSHFVTSRQVEGTTPYTELNITGNNFEAVRLRAVPVADTNVVMALQSSQNPEAWFNGKQQDLYSTLFPGPDSFVGTQNDQ
jgi:hypothetical protein